METLWVIVLLLTIAIGIDFYWTDRAFKLMGRMATALDILDDRIRDLDKRVEDIEQKKL